MENFPKLHKDLHDMKSRFVQLDQGRSNIKIDVIKRILEGPFITFLARKPKHFTVRTGADRTVWETFHQRTFKTDADCISTQFDSMFWEMSYRSLGVFFHADLAIIRRNVFTSTAAVFPGENIMRNPQCICMQWDESERIVPYEGTWYMWCHNWCFFFAGLVNALLTLDGSCWREFIRIQLHLSVSITLKLSMDPWEQSVCIALQAMNRAEWDLKF